MELYTRFHRSSRRQPKNIRMTHSSMRYLLSNRCEYLCLDTRGPRYQLWRLITATFMKITSYRRHHANEYKLRRLPVLLWCCRELPLHEDIGRVKTGSPLKLINAVAPGLHESHTSGMLGNSSRQGVCLANTTAHVRTGEKYGPRSSTLR